MRKNNFTKLSAFLILIFIIASSLSYLWFSGKYLQLFMSKNPVITLTSEGFQPKKIIVKKNTEVTFKSNLETSFWPASNAHPFHDLYSAFDSKKSLDSNETWSFNFEQIGIWDFHDHINSNMTGTIIVLSDSGKLPSLDDCTTLRGDEQNNCIYQGIKKTIEQKGLKKGFEKFSKLYSEYGRSFDIDCHEISHLIGKISYKEYRKNGLVDLPSETMSMCGYGFFHGYVEALISDGENLSLAKDFCEEYKNSVDGLENTCFHGIGHAIFDTRDYSLWGDDKALVDKSIELCRELGKISTYEDAVLWCADGVYSSLGVAYFNNFYRLSFDRVNPFKLCDIQAEEFKENCYYSPGTLWIKKQLGINFDLEDAVKLSKKIKYEKGLRIFFINLTQEYYKGHMNDKSPIDIFRECQSLIPTYLDSCISGVYQGMTTTNSNFSNQDVKNLCDSSQALGDGFKSLCYQTLD